MNTSRWAFPPLDDLPDDDLIAVGADLAPETLIEAYGSGYFPMPVGRRKLGWFSPVRRGVLLSGDLKVSRSLRRSLRTYTISVDAAFDDVIRACADPGRPHGWIDRDMIVAYTALHHRGFAHSVEVWDGPSLVGGLYGVSLGGLFAGESMFHRATDASKVALVALVDLLGPDPDRLLDVQWLTDHLETLGCSEIDRREYGRRLARARRLDPPDFFRPNHEFRETLGR